MTDATQTTGLTDEDVEWVTNDNAELGVKIGARFFFLYKGGSLEYPTGLHDDETPMRWRPVYKREFGECCHPWRAIEHYTGKSLLPSDFPAAYGDPNDWQEMPRRVTPEQIRQSRMTLDPKALDAAATKPYRVEIDDAGCECCDAGKTWVVVDWENTAGSISYTNADDAHDICSMLNAAHFAAIRALPLPDVGDGWMPIESAPKDGTNILAGVAGVPRSVGEMFWWSGGWRTWDGENHTRTVAYPNVWQPLPAPPRALDAGGGA